MPGTPGVCHAALGFQEHGFGLVCVSRPGYARTPLTDENKTAAGQADLIVALMDHLGIEKFPILAASGAGCIAYNIAIRHPDKVQALCMCCATSGDLDYRFYDDIVRGEGRSGVEAPIVGRYGSKYMPKYAKDVMKMDIMTANNQKKDIITDKEADEIASQRVKDPYLQTQIKDMRIFPMIGPLWPSSWEAMIVDLDYYKEKIDFSQIKTPTHIIHGDCDDDIPYQQSVNAAAGIEGAIFLTQKRGTHSCQFHPEWNSHIDHQMSFAKKHCGLDFDQAKYDFKFGPHTDIKGI